MAKKMSTGQDATLGNYLRNALIFFGEDSPAVRFLKKKIEEQGENEEVLADESQMVNLLCDLNVKGYDDGNE